MVDGRTLTSWPSLRTDLANAGATWVDEQVYVDQGLVTSRKPDDLPAFCDKMLEQIAEVTSRLKTTCMTSTRRDRRPAAVVRQAVVARAAQASSSACLRAMPSSPL